MEIKNGRTSKEVLRTEESVRQDFDIDSGERNRDRKSARNARRLRAVAQGYHLNQD